MKQDGREETTPVQSVQPMRLTLQDYVLPDMIVKLEKAFSEGYTFSEQAGSTAFRIGMQTYVELIHKDKLEDILTKEAEAKLEEALLKQQIADDAKKILEDERAGLKVAFEPISDGQGDEAEDCPDESTDIHGTILDGRGTTLDDETKAIMEIDWDLLNKKTLEGDKDYIKELGASFGISIPKNKSALNMVKIFKSGLDKL